MFLPASKNTNYFDANNLVIDYEKEVLSIITTSGIFYERVNSHENVIGIGVGSLPQFVCLHFVVLPLLHIFHFFSFLFFSHSLILSSKNSMMI
jgi:hypothetical protein